LMRIPYFLTGSRAYGTPRPDSDHDLVVLVTQEQVEALAQRADSVKSVSLRFGEYNLLCCTTHQHLAWQRGTAALIARAPVTRDEAVAEFQKQFR
jgi:hypothetical protein